MKMYCGAVVLLLCLLSTHASVFTVTNTNDSGPGSLRQAMLDANALPDLDLIAFNLSGNGRHRITPESPLPVLTNSVVVDGFTQPGAQPNTSHEGDTGIRLIELDGSRTLGDGLALSGASLPAARSSYFAVRGLVMHSFTNGSAISVSQLRSARAVLIEGNWIGTDAAGQAPSGNRIGVSVAGVTLARIGGTLPSARNVISGNGTAISVGPSGSMFSPYTVGALVEGNFIGTDATGTRAVPNQQGIICSSAQALEPVSVTVGGLERGAGNVISGNTGVAVEPANRAGVLVAGNRMGVGVSGTQWLPNEAPVIDIGHYSFGSAISNIISGNLRIGVLVPSGFEQVEGAVIEGNSIYLNHQLGINLQPGYSPMLPGPEPDNTVTLSGRGAPNITDFPQITSVTAQGDNFVINGALANRPGATCVVEFFRSATPDSSGFGQGEIPLGTQEVSFDASGQATFSFQTGENLSGQFITATATGGSRGYTSEFSKAVEVPGSFAGNIEFGSLSFTANRSATQAVVRVIRTDASRDRCAVHVETVDEEALAGTDFVAISRDLTFADGVTNQTFSVPLLPGSASGAPKSLGLRLTGPSLNAALGLIRDATVWLVDDSGTPALSVADASSKPGEPMVFTVRLSKPSDQAVTVNYATVDGTTTGTSGNSSVPPGFEPATGQLSFAPGELEKKISVQTLTGPTSGATFAVVLLDPVHADLARPFATGTSGLLPLLMINARTEQGTVPQLSISKSEAMRSLDWLQPPNPTWLLEMSTDLTTTSAWKNLAWDGQGPDGRNYYSIPPSEGPAAFYRLRRAP